MFPDNTFDVTPFHPLDFHAFRTKVLLPEAGILLIQQDLPHLSRKDAIKTMEIVSHLVQKCIPVKTALMSMPSWNALLG